MPHEVTDPGAQPVTRAHPPPRPAIGPAQPRHAAVWAMAEAVDRDGPPMLVVTPGPAPERTVVVRWANAAARELLAAELDPAGDAAPAHGRPAASPARNARPWRLALADELGGNASGREWVEASYTDAGGATRPLRFRVTAVPRRAEWLVWLRPEPDGLQHAQAAAALAERRFEVLGAHAPFGVIASEDGTRLRYVNRAFAALFGAAQDTLLGAGWLDHVAATDHGAVLRAVDAVAAGGTADVTVQLDRVAGEPRWVRLRLAPVPSRERLAAFVGTAEDVTGERERPARLPDHAARDPLTGLVTKARLLEMIDDAGQDGADVALLFCSPDDLRSLIDEHGHEAGDVVLVEIARRLAGSARDGDVVARLAGDEFVVLLRDVSRRAEADIAARRHLAALAEPVSVGGSPCTLAVAVGTGLLRDHVTAGEALRAARERAHGGRRGGGERTGPGGAPP